MSQKTTGAISKASPAPIVAGSLHYVPPSSLSLSLTCAVLTFHLTTQLPHQMPSETSFKEFPFESILGLDIEKLSDAELRNLRAELQARRVSAPTRAATVRRQQQVIKKTNSGHIATFEKLL